MAKRTESRYDQAQTTACNALLERLRSIAVQAVQGQDMDPSGDPLMDLLSDIQGDLEVAIALNTKLNADIVFEAETIAKTGRVRR